MYIYDGIKSSFQTIWTQKFRSFLTLLGIIIGVTSVVAMFSSVTGFKIVLERGVEGLGWNNTLIVQPDTGQQQMGGGRGFGTRMIFMTAQRRVRPLTFNDYQALRQEVETKYIYGMIDAWSRTIDNQWVRVRGTSLDFFESQTFPIAEGRFFNAFEMNRAQKVAVVGPVFIEQHFDGRCILGEYINFNNIRLHVIGVLDTDQLNPGGATNFNPWGRRWDLSAIYIPLRTAAVYLRQNMAIDWMALTSHDDIGFAYMQTRTTQVLLANRNMQRDFMFQDVNAQMLEMTAQMNDMLDRWTITLMIIASISLFVGGIGLFSTLIISINERMTEIGIRKSAGARDIDIFFYFIMEALTLSFIAGMIGITLGIMLTGGLSTAINMSIPVSVVSVIVGITFALGIGFLSGLYPAIKASKINPIQAIYYFD
jgi:putative ABC transport system permease protein